jgi:pimeloyl-ACP methyl ester carboxylesterase
MPQIQRDGFTVNFEVLGEDGVPLVLLAGMGEQIGSVEFADEHAALLAQRGFRVIRMDNRDCGLSLPARELPERDFMAAFAAVRRGEQPDHDYSLLDCADDVIAVLDALGIERAHLCGASLGGFIARFAAVRHPERVASLTIVMSGCGATYLDDGPQVPPTELEAMSARGERPEPDTAIEEYVEKWRGLWGPGFHFPEAWIRARGRHAVERSYRPEAYVRQLMAALFSPGLWQAQTGITCPVLIVHGDADKVFPVEHPHALQQRIPGSELMLVPGMGHNMPEEIWAEMADRMQVLVG